jgi:hypothetical protein
MAPFMRANTNTSQLKPAARRGHVMLAACGEMHLAPQLDFWYSRAHETKLGETRERIHALE